MDLKKLFIGIDSGGTNCRVGFGDGTGRIIHSGNYESIHYSQAGAESFSEHISGVIKAFCSEINLDLGSLSGICIGAAGARHASDKERLKSALSEKTGYGNIIVESDTAVAHYAAFRDDEGLLLISGTGSVLFGKYRGCSVRIGGWGKLLGDGGSSYSIALNFLRRMAESFDDSDSESPLEKSLKSTHGLGRENIIQEIYHGGFSIQSLTPFIIGRADEGDALCSEIIDAEADSLVRLLSAFRKKHGEAHGTEVAFLGSVIENDNYFRRRLKSKIADEFGDAFRVREEKINTLKGALKIAVKTFTDED